MFKSGTVVEAPVPNLIWYGRGLAHDQRIVGDLAAKVPVVLEIEREHSEMQLTGRSSDKDLLDKDVRKDEPGVERLTSAQDDQIFSVGVAYYLGLLSD